MVCICQLVSYCLYSLCKFIFSFEQFDASFLCAGCRLVITHQQQSQFHRQGRFCDTIIAVLYLKDAQLAFAQFAT